MPGVDLHTHSIASDGLLAPAELVAQAARLGISTLALTDHDTLAGLSAAIDAADAAGIDFIPGVELSAEGEGHETHVLGYYVNPADSILATELASLARQRQERTEKIVQRLNEIGLPVDYGRVEAIAAGGTIGRPHVARAMIERGYVTSVSEAFDRFLAAGQPGFVPRRKTRPEDSVALLRRANAVPVLAHPFSTGDVEATLGRLVAVGLLGIEVYYGEYSPDQHTQLRTIADRWGLVPTGGSDFHGAGFKEGRDLGSAPVPLDSAVRLRQRWKTLMGDRS